MERIDRIIEIDNWGKQGRITAHKISANTTRFLGSELNEQLFAE